jgi:hypothetical protein
MGMHLIMEMYLIVRDTSDNGNAFDNGDPSDNGIHLIIIDPFDNSTHDSTA